MFVQTEYTTASVNRATCSSRDNAAAEALLPEKHSVASPYLFQKSPGYLRYASTLFIRGGGDFLHDMLTLATASTIVLMVFPAVATSPTPGQLT